MNKYWSHNVLCDELSRIMALHVTRQKWNHSIQILHLCPANRPALDPINMLWSLIREIKDRQVENYRLQSSQGRNRASYGSPSVRICPTNELQNFWRRQASTPWINLTYLPIKAFAIYEMLVNILQYVETGEKHDLRLLKEEKLKLVSEVKNIWPRLCACMRYVEHLRRPPLTLN